MKEFKYKTKFNISAGLDLGKAEAYASNELISKASLEDLQSLLPDENIRKSNPDLLYAAFPAFVANLINDNDDGIMTDEAIAIAPFFKDKQCNIEHMRGYIVGHCISHGFSNFSDNTPIKESALAGTKDPFNVSLGAVVYRVADKWFAEDLENSTDPKSYIYQGISASWELGFDEFVIAMGSKQLSEAEMVTEDSQVAELQQYLRAYGGTGFTPDGIPVYRVVVGNANPLGIGFTNTPAASVKGVTTANDEDEYVDIRAKIVEILQQDPTILEAVAKIEKAKNEPIKKPEKSPEEVEEEVLEQEQIAASSDKNKDKDKKNKDKSSQTANGAVIKNMKINSLDDIQQDQMEEIAASDIRSFVGDKLNEANDKYVALETAKNEAEAKIKKELEDTVAKADKSEEDLKEIKAKFEKLEEETKAAAQAVAFTERMSSLDEKYELEDTHKQVIARQIKGLDDDNYKVWREDFDVMNAAAVRTEETPDPEKREEKTKEELAEEALASAKPDGSGPPNADGDGEEDEMAKYRDSFKLGEGVVIK